MKNEVSKKEAQRKYKERDVVGGVYVVKNTQKNKLFLDATTDLRANKNRFEFAAKMGICVYAKLRDDWTEQGGDKFSYEVLEELKKGETQTMEDFKSDIDLLKNMWFEKLSNESLY